MKIDVHTLIGDDCITLDDGQKVHDQILPELKAGHPVELDFEGVGVFASPFFNAAFGQLLKDLPGDDLNRLITIDNLNPVGMSVLKRVIENSKKYYSDPKYRRIVNKVLDEQAANG
jgi:hypothetical protein